MKRAELLERFYARDARHDGTFLVGVVTTGIYCLPSCPAKKPKPENVRFFEDETGARAVGLRACKRCRPDHFYRHYDPDRELVQAAIAEVRRRPGDFADARELGRSAGVGQTKLAELFRAKLHTTPAAFLARSRVAWAAAELLATERRVLDIALDAGFQSQSSFHENFRRSYHMAPGAYRRLTREDEFTLSLPADWRPDEARAMFERSHAGLCERADGRTWVKALELDGRTVRLEYRFRAGAVRVRLESSKRSARSTRALAHLTALRTLGLVRDPAPFEKRALRVRSGARLLGGRRGVRIPQTADAFEGLVWVIVGQQVNLTFARTCRDVVIELAGKPTGELTAHPSPEAVAQLDYTDLTTRQFSRRKAEYVIDTARAITNGELDLESLRDTTSDSLTETLDAVRGLGPWSIAYLSMRSFGLEDCVPVGDAGLVAALRSFYRLDHRPDVDETLALLAPFAPYRSLATYRFWMTLGDDS